VAEYVLHDDERHIVFDGERAKRVQEGVRRLVLELDQILGREQRRLLRGVLGHVRVYAAQECLRISWRVMPDCMNPAGDPASSYAFIRDLH
jgi:hypothetical protein